MYIHPCSCTLTYPGLVTCKQFDPDQTRETGADLDPNHLTSVTGIKAWGFRHPEVCSKSDLANIADPDQVLRHVASGRAL